MRRLTEEEKLLIGTLVAEEYSVKNVAKRLRRAYGTIESFVNSRTFERHYSVVWYKGQHRRAFQGVDYRCALCDKKLDFDTDGNGKLLEYCRTHGYKVA